MPRRNAHWYTLNASRDYPVDETSTCLSDSGERLPSDILVDLRLRWPKYLGDYVFVSAVSVTPYAVSVAFQSATTRANVGGEDNMPLATLTVLRDELLPGRAYAVEPSLEGVFGYVVFGGGIERLFNGRFSAPAQTWLTPRAARPYPTPPVTGMRRVGNQTALTGLVLLRGTSPVEVVKESREIGGVERDVIVVRLVGDPSDLPAVFETYAGPCAKRPESFNCGDPQPIEYINAVGPDCTGTVEIELQGCAIVGQNIDDGSIIVDCALSLSDACPPPFLPDTEGRLPSEYEQFLVSVGDVSQSEPEPTVDSTPVYNVVGTFPHVECFTDRVADQFSVKSGEFQFEQSYDRPVCLDTKLVYDALSTYAAVSLNVPNVSVWEGFDISTLFRLFTTELQLMPTSTGGKSGGIILNYRPHQTIANTYVFFFVALEEGRLSLYRWNGASFKLLAYSEAYVDYGYWYTLQVQTEVVDNNIMITATCGEAGAYLGPIIVQEYAPDDGNCGVGSYLGHARFASFQVNTYGA